MKVETERLKIKVRDCFDKDDDRKRLKEMKVLVGKRDARKRPKKDGKSFRKEWGKAGKKGIRQERVWKDVIFEKTVRSFREKKIK